MLKHAIPRTIRKVKQLTGFGPNFGTASFALDLKEVKRRIGDNPCELENIFVSNNEHGMPKWVHYLSTYDKHLNRYRGRPFKMLEIGVFDGGSLNMWRKYFGNEAVIFGIDILPECASKAVPPNQIRIGSQDDPEFLARVVGEMGGLDVVLDDGCHLGRYQIASFKQTPIKLHQARK